jgi:hypothetical protein
VDCLSHQLIAEKFECPQCHGVISYTQPDQICEQALKDIWKIVNKIEYRSVNGGIPQDCLNLGAGKKEVEDIKQAIAGCLAQKLPEVLR